MKITVEYKGTLAESELDEGDYEPSMEEVLEVMVIPALEATGLTSEFLGELTKGDMH